MNKILVVNHAHSHVCGIHDLGLRIVHRLATSREIDVSYVEANDWLTFLQTYETVWPDVVLINYRHDLMPWVAPRLRDINGIKIAVMHNYEVVSASHVALGLTSLGFDFAMAFDPTLHVKGHRILTTGRVLPEAVDPVPLPDDETHIGSFGFAFPHKRFDLVAALIAETLSKGAYHLHMPEAYFNGANGGALFTQTILDNCRRLLPHTCRLEYTNDHVNEREVVSRLAACHVNCLLYQPGQPDAGLSSALDYLIAARRPILVSEASMFRHGGNAVACWPHVKLGDVLDDIEVWTERVSRLYDEQMNRVVYDFEQLMSGL